ncbi:hypothetical protein TVAG_016740 [Trichomonas vaginalis G3]|uniref:Uncharacterized protein n=1 Tax=Trichomonas vaginalis (strain ATCC PRA-98 / G3) TaxID=412133 RepID=A2ER12_TRIV3|nr:protein ubiquitination [Trichomonas vaginalis G3]EAY04902.1 hypothetical protein TVAG_016740 [Trichomonas vaginalis G3]KAI5519440.1 protein ubiquitination [Trichomonas vaginalis G3]|eukprot:XP_001317125.1 hypothetical protein [Trichomonas vaginalis G3]
MLYKVILSIIKDFFDYLTKIRSNLWIVPYDFPLKSIIDSLKTDDVTSLKSIVNSKSEADTKINPSILLAPPILGFSAPYVSLASFFGSIKCLEYLNNLGADLLQEDDEGRQPIQFALAGGNIECAQFLKNHSNLSFEGCLSISIEYLNRDEFN